MIPDCNPNPYSVQGCMVAGVSLASALVLGQLGGTYIAIALGLIVSLPLFSDFNAIELAETEKAKQLI